MHRDNSSNARRARRRALTGFGGPLLRMRSMRRVAGAGVALLAASAALAAAEPLTPLGPLLEALRARNPEVAAAAQELEAARARSRSARALEDPMLETGVLNVPTPSWSLRDEDMTMKMVGLSQRLPFPGKRRLRAAVALESLEGAAARFRDTLQRSVRDLKVAYNTLGRTDAEGELVRRTKQALEQLLAVAEARYAVGQATQADVLKAQTELAKMSDELITLEAERAMLIAELLRLAGRPQGASLRVKTPTLSTHPAALEDLASRAVERRPLLQALEAARASQEQAVALAQREYYPDFDLRLSYGQRERAPSGMPREDMVSLSVAINLPLWRQGKLAPIVAEARAMREQSARMLDAARLATQAGIAQQRATLERTAQSARLYATSILPQARLTLEVSLSAYRVNRVDFPTVLDNQMTVFDYERALLEATSAHENALAELEYLAGTPLEGGAASQESTP